VNIDSTLLCSVSKALRYDPSVTRGYVPSIYMVSKAGLKFVHLKWMLTLAAKVTECVLLLVATVRRCTCSWHSWASLYIVIGITEGLYVVNMCNSALYVTYKYFYRYYRF